MPPPPGLPPSLPHDLLAFLEETELPSLQPRLFEDWSPGDEDLEEKARFVRRLRELDEARRDRGGLRGYLDTMRMKLSGQHDAPPLEDVAPPLLVETVPFCGESHFRFEKLGATRSFGGGRGERVVFVLVAGGLGERLGVPDRIKLSLITENVTRKTFWDVFSEAIVAYHHEAASREKNEIKPTIVIMTSRDNDEATRRLVSSSATCESLEVIYLQQNTVPAVSDLAGNLAKSGRYTLLEKPHGHGDVHELLYDSGLPRKWHEEGRFRRIVFFQDTNPSAMRTIPVALGVSISRGWACNVIGVPRPAKSQIGSLVSCRGHALLNLEYNLLSNFAVVDENDPLTGHSSFLGNTNQMVFELEAYLRLLRASGGGKMPEFVNPKWKGGESRVLESPARLECMMQDILLFAEAEKLAAGVTLFRSWDRWEGRGTHVMYAPAKNSLALARKAREKGASDGSAVSSEFSIYAANCGLMEAVLGMRFVSKLSGRGGENDGSATCGSPSETRRFAEMDFALCPRVAITARGLPFWHMLVEKSLLPEGGEGKKTRNLVEITLDSELLVDDFSKLETLVGALANEKHDEPALRLNGTLHLIPGQGESKIRAPILIDLEPSMRFVAFSSNGDQDEDDDQLGLYKLLRGFYCTRRDALIVKL